MVETDTIVARTVSNIILNKWVLLISLGLILYATGAFDIIADNPVLVVFAGLIVLVVISTGGKNK